MLRGGFDLPPLMFTEDEAEAIAVGVRMLARTGDPGLQKADIDGPPRILSSLGHPLQWIDQPVLHPPWPLVLGAERRADRKFASFAAHISAETDNGGPMS